MKRTFIILLTMLFGVVSVQAQSFVVDGISYNVTQQPNDESPGEVKVTGGEIRDVIEFPETVTYDNVTYTVTSIGNNAFSGRTNSSNCTKKYIIPGTVRTIENSAFYDNYYLEEVEFNEGLQTIGASAFGYNFLLQEIRIPCTVTSIGNSAFITNQKNLATISCLAETPPSIQPSSFSGRTEATLHVVASCGDSYEEAENWKDFSEISDDIIFTQRCYAPKFSLDNNLLTVSCKTEGAAIYYTTDGSIPNENAIPYTSPISYATYPIIRAIAVAEGMENSRVGTFYDKEQMQQITDEQGICYTLKQADDDSFYYSVTGHTDELNAEIVIPADLEGCPVRTIENGSKRNNGMSNGTPPYGYEYKGAFSGCTELLSVTIPNSVTLIGNCAFANCTGLTTVTIPNSVTSIGSAAFANCSALTKINIPKKVTSIGEEAFWMCTSLSSITIPNSVTYIGNRAFYLCSSLTSATIGNGVASLEVGTFQECSSLTTIIIPNSVTCIKEGLREYLFSYQGRSYYYDWGVFLGCTSLTTVTIPNSVKTIGSYAFSRCSSLASVNFEDGLTSIGEYAFTDCILPSLTIPNSVTSIGRYAFWGNNNLTTVILGEGIEEIEECTFRGCRAITSVTIPDGVTSIGNNAFQDCEALTSIKLPESLATLGEYVFPYALKSIELPNAFTVIPENLFRNNNFQYIKLGNNVKSIGKNAFGSYDLVIEISTSTPPTIDKDAFPYVEFLEDINVIVPNAEAETAYRKAAVWEDMTFSNQNNVSEVTVDTPGDLSFELITECNMMPAKVVNLKVNGTINADDFTQMLVNMKSLLHLDLSDCDITAIPDDALNGKTQLQELTLPTGLQSIGKNAFRNCPYLTGELEIPSTVTSIGESAFVGTYYTSVSLPNTLKTIGNEAFYNLPLKQRLSLPGSVNTVGERAFEGTKIESLSVPRSMRTIGNRAFANTQITSVTIQDGVKSIGDEAFANSPIRGHVTIPDGVTYLGDGAFKNTQLSTVFLPNSVTTLSQGLFQGCPNLNLVYVPDNYTAMNSSVFDGCESLNILRLSANTESMGAYSLQNTPLDYIKIPSKVETLPTGVLRNCTKLESLALPAELKTVEGEALYGCTALRNMSVEATTPPVIKNRSAIRGINTDKCLISIPTSAYRSYVLAEYWGQFVQMRNDIAVETAGNGEIAFESVVEDEDEEEVSETKEFGPRRATARARRRAQLATDEESMTYANNGSSVYVPQQGQVRFYIIPGDGEEILSATLDGVDIMPYIVDGVYTATADKKNAKLVVKFSGQGSAVMAGDVNGDNKVDTQDAIKVIQYYLGKNPTDFQLNAADVNGDGKVDTQDAIQIIKIYLNKQ